MKLRKLAKVSNARCLAAPCKALGSPSVLGVPSPGPQLGAAAGPGEKRLTPSGRARRPCPRGYARPSRLTTSSAPGGRLSQPVVAGGALGARTGPRWGEAASSRRPQTTWPESRPQARLAAPRVRSGAGVAAAIVESRSGHVDPGGLHKERTPGWSYSSGIRVAPHDRCLPRPHLPDDPESRIARTGLSWGHIRAHGGKVWVLRTARNPTLPARADSPPGGSDTRHLTPNRPSAPLTTPTLGAPGCRGAGPPPCRW